MEELQDSRRERLDVDRALQLARRHEARRTIAWLVATAIVFAVAAPVTRDMLVAMVAVAFGVSLLLWSLRLRAGVGLALRDLRKAATPPRRAFVELLDDVNPRALRALLGIWAAQPVAGRKLPKPDRVYRCDDELEDLKCFPGGAVVHEAWVDTGPRAWSKPRWVAADEGIAVVHRRAMLGRWYMSMLVRRDRPDSPRPLTIEPPAPARLMEVEPPALKGGLPGEVGTRVVLLLLIAAVAWWMS